MPGMRNGMKMRNGGGVKKMRGGAMAAKPVGFDPKSDDYYGAPSGTPVKYKPVKKMRGGGMMKTAAKKKMMRGGAVAKKKMMRGGMAAKKRGK